MGNKVAGQIEAGIVKPTEQRIEPLAAHSSSIAPTGPEVPKHAVPRAGPAPNERPE